MAFGWIMVTGSLSVLPIKDEFFLKFPQIYVVHFTASKHRVAEEEKKQLVFRKHLSLQNRLTRASPATGILNENTRFVQNSDSFRSASIRADML
jgi:hypothetical protein